MRYTVGGWDFVYLVPMALYVLWYVVRGRKNNKGG